MSFPTDKYHPMYLETLGAWALFRNFGYPPEEIYVALPDTTIAGKVVTQVMVIIQHEGKEAHIKVCVTDVDKEEFLNTWKEAAEDYNNANDYDRKKLFNKSRARKEAVTIMASMHKMGLGCTPKQIQERLVH